MHRVAALARCRECVQACPRSAWTIDGQGLGFDEARCDACGLCAVACPTGALTASLAWPQPRLGHPGVRTVALTCERAVTPTVPGRPPLPCVHAVDEAQLLRWHGEGAGGLRLSTGDCASCPRRPATSLPERLHRVNEVLRARGQPILRLERGDDPHDRMTQATAGVHPLTAAEAAGRAASPAQAARSDGAVPPDCGRRSLLGLRGRGAPAASPAAARATTTSPRREATQHLARMGPGPALWAVVFDPDRCDACGACARVCPTRAIDFASSAPAGGVIAFEMARCVGCALCVDVCAVRALTSAIPLRAAGARKAWALTSVKCRGCGRSYLALQGSATCDAGRCPSCRSVGARRSDRIVQTAAQPRGGADANPR